MNDKKTITNKFNIFVANIGSNLSVKIKIPMNNTFQSYLTGTHNNNFHFTNINEDITLSIVDKLVLVVVLMAFSQKLLRQ